MADELLPYYEKELAYIRQQGARFANEHPKIAGRLGISADTIEDPHVSRLIESFAYLNARIHHKLDDDFPELSEGLLQVVFPHYQRHIPSMSIVNFSADKEQLESSYKIASKTLVETEQYQGETCKFSTVYPVTLLPIEVISVKVMGRPFATPGANLARGSNTVVHIKLKTFSDSIDIKTLDLSILRFYLKGQSQHIYPLYEALFNEINTLVLTADESDLQPTVCPIDAIKTVGFQEDEGIIPYPVNSHMGYRLLTEYFIFPEKFLFIDFVSLNAYIPDSASNEINLYVYLEKEHLELEHHISKENWILGCSPVVNLFEHKVDPIKVDLTQDQYQVIPDVRRPHGFEVYNVTSVQALCSNGEKFVIPPLYGLTHENLNKQIQSFWQPHVKSSSLHNSIRDEATHTFLRIVDRNLNQYALSAKTLLIEAMCSNRLLPEKLPYNLDQPRLECVNSAPPCHKIRFIIQPTQRIQPPLRDGAQWRLISHLNLNHLSIQGSENPLEALKEILRLYDFKDSSATRSQIDSLVELNAKSISAPLLIDGRTSICRGTEVTLTVDDLHFSGSSSYLFATVLEHFFALYGSINSFTRLIAKRKNKEGYLKKCSPRAGSKALL
jgi:type VI secretion system protein ImpG